MQPRTRLIACLLAAVMGPASPASRTPASSTAGERPSLVVVVSVDQFRADYVTRFHDLYGPAGLNRILDQGFSYDRCLYASANTETGPGHATMLTGTYAHLNGITQNAWYEASGAGPIYCVLDPAVSALSSGESLDRRTALESRSSPRNLLAPTVGDVLEAATLGASRTLSLSGKDRAAILMGGRSADLALWFDRNTGEFVSSSYYGARLPAWVKAFNDSARADRWFHQDWDLSLADRPAEYATRATPDDFPGEDAAQAGFTGDTFPHELGEKSRYPDRAYYRSLSASPFLNDLLLDLAENAIHSEHLGHGDAPDLLTLSFSANDYVGHAFGPDSWEVMDCCLRTDRVIAELLTFLDDEVGAGRWTLFLTAITGSRRSLG